MPQLCDEHGGHAVERRDPLLLQRPDNGRLQRTLVNRYWARLLGRGLVEPVDEMDRLPWDQDVLDWLDFNVTKASGRERVYHPGTFNANPVTAAAAVATLEIIESTSFEEANAAIIPWVRQRARWQKGYLLTWAVAMRAPFALIRALGMWRFLALQVQILCAVAGFLIAPLLWSLMIKPFGYAHPLDLLVSPFGYGILATIFVASVVLSIALAIHATRPAHLRHLRPYILLSELYFLLGTISAWRAARYPGNAAYILRNAPTSRAGLDALTDPQTLATTLLHACERPTR